MGSNYPRNVEKGSTLLHGYNVSLEKLHESQALLRDCKNLVDLNWGHLNLKGHHLDYSSRMATFTLTNRVPQDEKPNGSAWKKLQRQTMVRKTQGCNITYVMVGAVPGNNCIAKEYAWEYCQGRVNKPTYTWWSACCEKNPKEMGPWVVIAEIDKNQVLELRMGQMKAMLTQLYGRGQVSLFHSTCPWE